MDEQLLFVAEVVNDQRRVDVGGFGDLSNRRPVEADRTEVFSAAVRMASFVSSGSPGRLPIGRGGVVSVFTDSSRPSFRRALLAPARRWR